MSASSDKEDLHLINNDVDKDEDCGEEGREDQETEKGLLARPNTLLCSFSHFSMWLGRVALKHLVA